MKVFGTLCLVALLGAPLYAQVDLVGEWGQRQHEDQPERGPGPELGDYLGLPINAAARAKADAWDASLLTLPEWQCRPHPADYGTRGPSNMRIWKEVDPATQQVIAYHTHIAWQAPERTIWMDGRAHPPEYAAHTWQGFSTGKWEGQMLTVTTTHLKPGFIRRNGVPRSEKGMLVEHWIRHGDVLTMLEFVTDPVYLTGPMVRSQNWVWTRDQDLAPYPCESVTEVPRELGVVPHHLPGTNTFLHEFAAKYKLPYEVTRGGSETMYPEYRQRIEALRVTEKTAASAK